MKITWAPDTYYVEDLKVSPLQERMYCVFDLEGTGINPAVESVTQFGAMHYKRGQPCDTTFSSLVRANKPIPEAVANLTGISNEDMLLAPSFMDAFQAFQQFIGDHVLVTQAGYEYDLPILKRHCEQYGLPMLTNPVLDTKAMFTYIHPEVSEVVSTDYLIRYYDLNTEGIHRHDALADCGVIARIFECILGEYEELQLDHFTADPERMMKRFVVPEMYLTRTDAERLLADLNEGGMLSKQTFEGLDVEVYLDERDTSEFANEWMQAFVRWVQSSTVAEEEVLRACRKQAFKQTLALTGEPELAGYVSDDMGLIGAALLQDAVHDSFVNQLLASYRQGRLPLR